MTSIRNKFMEKWKELDRIDKIRYYLMDQRTDRMAIIGILCFIMGLIILFYAIMLKSIILYLAAATFGILQCVFIIIFIRLGKEDLLFFLENKHKENATYEK